MSCFGSLGSWLRTSPFSTEMSRGGGGGSYEPLQSPLLQKEGALSEAGEPSLLQSLRHLQRKILTTRDAHLRACKKLEEAESRGEEVEACRRKKENTYNAWQSAIRAYKEAEAVAPYPWLVLRVGLAIGTAHAAAVAPKRD